MAVCPDSLADEEPERASDVSGEVTHVIARKEIDQGSRQQSDSTVSLDRAAERVESALLTLTEQIARLAGGVDEAVGGAREARERSVDAVYGLEQRNTAALERFQATVGQLGSELGDSLIQVTTTLVGVADVAERLGNLEGRLDRLTADLRPALDGAAAALENAEAAAQVANRVAYTSEQLALVISAAVDETSRLRADLRDLADARDGLTAPASNSGACEDGNVAYLQAQISDLASAVAQLDRRVSGRRRRGNGAIPAEQVAEIVEAVAAAAAGRVVDPGTPAGSNTAPVGIGRLRRRR